MSDEKEILWVGSAYEPWTAILGPVAMPKDIVTRLYTEARKVASQPDLVKRWSSQGLEPRDISPEQMTVMIREESARNAKVIAEKGIRAE